jgi:histidine triad (HIT) family protein
MSTIFTKIINGEIPSYKIYEDDYTYSFLDIKPFHLGHTLVVSKIEVDYFVDVPEPYYSAVFQTAKKIAPAIQKATKTERIGTLIEGLEVPHFHYHLIPIKEENGFIVPRKSFGQQEYEEIAKKIRSYL